MTGKRPRALTRTASVSQLSSGNLSQEFSPLLENPKEKLKPTIKPDASPTAGCSSPRVVIGFDPKPSAHGLNLSECGVVASPKSAPCSPSFHDKASSPRSVLNSLFSRQRVKPATPTDGVGLGIVLHAPTPTLAPEDIKISILERPGDHIAIPVRDDVVSPPQRLQIPVVHTRRHSHPIPTPGISPCHSTHHHAHCKDLACEAAAAARKGSHPPALRPVLGWMEHDVLKRDTFLLAASPARSLMASENAAAVLTASSSHFLDECSFCKRHLPKDKDIFMYR